MDWKLACGVINRVKIMQILQNLSRHFFGECTHTETGGKRVGKARVTFAGSQLESLAHIDRAQTLLIIRVLPAALSHSLSLFYIFLGVLLAKSAASNRKHPRCPRISASMYPCICIRGPAAPWVQIRPDTRYRCHFLAQLRPKESPGQVLWRSTLLADVLSVRVDAYIPL